MGTVITIQRDSDGFVRSVNIVVSTNASKMFEIGIPGQTGNKLVLLFESTGENNTEKWSRTQDEIWMNENCAVLFP